MPRRAYRSAILITLLTLLGGTAAPVSAATPLSLSGEDLFSGIVPGAVTATCNPDGTSTVTFRTSGTAVGPYPGTFEESGTFTISPQDITGARPFGTVVTAELKYTIYSGATTITGTKTIDLASNQRFASCAEVATTPGFCETAFNRQGPGTGLYVEVVVQVRYEALIQTVDGTFRDKGTASARLTDFEIHCVGSVTFSNRFVESFFSDGVVTPVGPASVTLSPAVSTNPVGTDHTVMATVTNLNGGPVANVTVRFSVSGSVSTSGTCTTNAAGQCNFTYTGPSLPGADAIVGCADSNNSGAIDPGEPCGEAAKAWLIPATTAGHVTGGGHVLAPSDNEKVAFGFQAKTTNNGLTGNCTVVDIAPTRNVKVKCLDVTSLVQTTNSATFFGNAEINGAPTTYRIDVTDNGEPGKGLDTFVIQTSSGYSAGGVLDHGNIQVHRAG